MDALMNTFCHDVHFQVQDLVLERKWELLVGPVFFENFENNNPGR